MRRVQASDIKAHVLALRTAVVVAGQLVVTAVRAAAVLPDVRRCGLAAAAGHQRAAQQPANRELSSRRRVRCTPLSRLTRIEVGSR